MEYAFFTGPVNIEAIYPGIEKRSSLIYTRDKISFFVNYRGQEFKVVKNGMGGFYVASSPFLSYDDILLLEHRISNGSLPVQEKIKTLEYLWSPEVNLTEENSWLSLILHQGQIVGYYFGFIQEDDLGRLYSSHSYISIRPDYQGRGLCKDFSKYTYGKIYEVFDVDYIYLSVAAERKAGACRCYIRAGKELGFRTYGSFEEYGDIVPDYKIRKVSDCNAGNLIYLIFTTKGEIDNIMIESVP